MRNLVLAVMLLFMAGASPAHHSFAVFFNTDAQLVKITGVVQSFVFSNPHGVITLAVAADSGVTKLWRAETNSPSILRRRGWKPDSVSIGSKVTLEGWPARDGTDFIRMRAAWDSNGKLIGQPLIGP